MRKCVEQDINRHGAGESGDAWTVQSHTGKEDTTKKKKRKKKNSVFDDLNDYVHHGLPAAALPKVTHTLPPHRPVQWAWTR